MGISENLFLHFSAIGFLKVLGGESQLLEKLFFWQTTKEGEALDRKKLFFSALGIEGEVPAQ